MNLNKQNRFGLWVKRAVLPVTALGVGLLVVGSCGDLTIQRGDATPGVRTLAVTSATYDVAALEEESGSLALKATTTAVATGCSYALATNGASSSGSRITHSPQFDSAADAQASLFSTSSLSPATWMRVRTVKMYLYYLGTPDNVFYAEIQSNNSGSPAGTALGTSATFDYHSVPGASGGVGGLVDLTYTTPVDLPLGSYWVVLKSGGNTLIGNYVSWVTSTSASALACTGFSDALALRLENPATWGINWATGSVPATTVNQRGLFQVVADVFTPSASATWIVAAFKNAQWDLSTFSVTENPGGTGGTVTYDVGAGNDPVTPTYTLVGKTKAEVLSAASISGTYLYVRVNMSVASPYYDRAAISDITVTANSP